MAVPGTWSYLWFSTVLGFGTTEHGRVQLSFGTTGQFCSRGSLLRHGRQGGSFSSLSTYITFHTVRPGRAGVGGARGKVERKGSHRLSLKMSTGAANWAFWKISVVHLKYVCIPLTFRKSSSEFIGISDLSTLHTNPAPGAGAGPGQGICGNSAFHPSIWWAEG